MKLIVKPLDRQSAGQGIAVLDHEAMTELGVESGDFVTIRGETGTAVARVRPGRVGKQQRGIVGIDGQIRKSTGARLDQLAQVEQADVAPADALSIALPQGLQIRGDMASYLRDKIANRAVQAGQTVPLALGFGSLMSRSGRQIPIRIVETDPDGTVIVTQSTDITIVEQSVEETDIGQSSDVADSSEPLGITYEDVGGLDDELDQVREMIELPMSHPELFQALGIEPPQGVLLHGPPGTGKTLIAKAVANEIDANFQNISGPEIMSKYHGESEERLREVFDEAGENEPAIIFIDEIDSIAPKRDETQGDVERRVVAQLLSLMDGLEDRGQVTVIGTTNRVDAVDTALRRGGRFDREIEIGVPDTRGRTEILQRPFVL